MKARYADPLQLGVPRPFAGCADCPESVSPLTHTSPYASIHPTASASPDRPKRQGKKALFRTTALPTYCVPMRLATQRKKSFSDQSATPPTATAESVPDCGETTCLVPTPARAGLAGRSSNTKDLAASCGNVRNRRTAEKPFVFPRKLSRTLVADFPCGTGSRQRFLQQHFLGFHQSHLLLILHG